MHFRSVLAELHRLDPRLRLPARPAHDEAAPHEGPGGERCACAVAVKNRRAHAYNEEAFRYFFALERQRARRSGRALLLLLVDAKDHPRARAHLEPRVVPRLFWALSRCLRETDIMGWYRERCVAGALLTGLDEEPRPEMAGLFVQRTTRILSEVLPAETTRLQVRLYQHRELVAGEK